MTIPTAPQLDPHHGTRDARRAQARSSRNRMGNGFRSGRFCCSNMARSRNTFSFSDGSVVEDRRSAAVYLAK